MGTDFIEAAGGRTEEEVIDLTGDDDDAVPQRTESERSGSTAADTHPDCRSSSWHSSSNRTSEFIVMSSHSDADKFLFSTECVESSFKDNDLSSSVDLFAEDMAIDHHPVSSWHRRSSPSNGRSSDSREISASNGADSHNSPKRLKTAAEAAAEKRPVDHCTKLLNSPEESLRLTQILIDSRTEHVEELCEALKHLLDSGAIKALKSLNVQRFIEVGDFPFPGIIMFQRPSPVVVDDVRGRRQTLNQEVDDQMLVVVPLSRFLSLVHHSVGDRRNPQHADTAGNETTTNLGQFTDELVALFLPKRTKMTFVVFDLDDYYKELRLLESAILKRSMVNKTESVTAKKYPILSSCGVTVNREKILEATIGLQLSHGVTFLWPRSPSHFAETVITFARAICERYVRMRREQLNSAFTFLAEGDLARGVKVDASGKGLREVWKRALQQCFGVSFQDGAEAIVRQYGCPNRLMQAYEVCGSEQEKQLLLADIKLRTKNNFNRRLGDAFSRKVCRALTCKDPNYKIV